MKIRAIATLHRRAMNRVEEAYARHLRDRQLVGEIRWWFFEAMKLRLADNTFYTPDFVVVANDLALEAHEVKHEWSTGKPGWHEDARVKIKVAAETFPIRFIAATQMHDGSWQFEEFLQEREERLPPQKLGTDVVSVLSERLNCYHSLDAIIEEITRLQKQAKDD